MYIYLYTHMHVYIIIYIYIHMYFYLYIYAFLLDVYCMYKSFLAETFPDPRPGFECVVGTKMREVTHLSQNVTFQVRCDAARFCKSLF